MIHYCWVMTNTAFAVNAPVGMSFNATVELRTAWKPNVRVFEPSKKFTDVTSEGESTLLL